MRRYFVGIWMLLALATFWPTAAAAEMIGHVFLLDTQTQRVVASATVHNASITGRDRRGRAYRITLKDTGYWMVFDAGRMLIPLTEDLWYFYDPVRGAIQKVRWHDNTRSYADRRTTVSWHDQAYEALFVTPLAGSDTALAFLHNPHEPQPGPLKGFLAVFSLRSKRVRYVVSGPLVDLNSKPVGFDHEWNCTSRYLFMANERGTQAIDLRTGRPTWFTREKLTGAGSCAKTAWDFGDQVLLRTDAGLSCLDAASGRVIWRFPDPAFGDEFSDYYVYRRPDGLLLIVDMDYP